METSQQSWYQARQEEAMIEQFKGPELRDESELHSWRKIRRTAVTRKLKRLPAKISNRRPRRGELWMVYIPGRPDDPHQPRPALVISKDVRNRLTDDVIIVPIFSTGRLGPTRVQLASGSGGLRRSGLLFCEEITTIDRDFLDRGPLGQRLPAPVLDAVVRAVTRALGDTVPEP